MELEVRVTQDGREAVYMALPGDLVAWEAWSGRSMRDWADTPPTYSDVAYIAYRAATKGNASRPSFEDWLDAGVTDLAFGDVNGGNPTQPDQ